MLQSVDKDKNKLYKYMGRVPPVLDVKTCKKLMIPLLDKTRPTSPDKRQKKSFLYP